MQNSDALRDDDGDALPDDDDDPLPDEAEIERMLAEQRAKEEAERKAKERAASEDPSVAEYADACRKFVETFEHAYYYRGLFQIQRPSNRPVERGALLHHHDGPWVAHGLCQTAGGYEHLRTFKAAPTRAQLSNLPW